MELLNICFWYNPRTRKGEGKKEKLGIIANLEEEYRKVVDNDLFKASEYIQPPIAASMWKNSELKACIH